MKTIKILVIGADNAPGGVAGYVNSIVNNLDTSQFEFHALVSNSKGKRFLSELIRLHELTLDYGLISFISHAIKLKKIVKIINPDIIHLHTARAGFLGVISLQSFNIPFIYSGHSWRFEQKSNSIIRLLLKQIERYISLKSDFVTFLTQRDLDLGLRDSLVRQSNSLAINTRIISESNGEDVITHRLMNFKAQKIPTVINIGQICDRKNPLLFIEIAKRILNVKPSVCFEWLGDGELKNKVEKKVAAFNISQYVRLPGYLDRVQVDKKLAISDLLLFTSKFEGVPLAILEAKLMGIPVVAGNYPGIESVVRHGIDGFVFDLTDPESASSQVIMLLSDDELYSNFAKAGYTFAVREHSNPTLMANEFGSIYEKLVNKG